MVCELHIGRGSGERKEPRESTKEAERDTQRNKERGERRRKRNTIVSKWKRAGWKVRQG